MPLTKRLGVFFQAESFDFLYSDKDALNSAPKRISADKQ